MRQLTREWVEKAEGDQEVAESQWSSATSVYTEEESGSSTNSEASLHEFLVRSAA
jgi:hypothetical protein